jgi:hypothetical protein
MSRYVSLGTVKQYLGIDGTVDDTLIQACIDRAEAAIDSYTRRNFVGTTGTVYASRYEQDRVRNNAFWLQEDLHTLIALTLGDGQSVPVGATGSVWLEPREGPPYRAIRLKSAYVYSWNTDQDMLIVGTWGYGTVPPDDIIQATIRTSAYYYRSKDSVPTSFDTGVIGNEALGQQQMRGLPQDVIDILARYRSRSGGVV